MKLSHKDALSILGLSGNPAFEDVKTAYRKACSHYHPDRNPAGLEMMKLVNAAWQALSDYVPGIIADSEPEALNLGEEMNTALNAIIHLGLTIEICGAWIWVSGDTREHKELLKASGYRWAPKKLMWHWRPADSKRSWGRGQYCMDEIRLKHGSFSVKPKSYARLAG